MENKTKYPRDMSFVDRQGKVVHPSREVDRQGKVVHPSREDYNAKRSAKDGKAYGFFDCNATKEEIEREIPFIMDAVINTEDPVDAVNRPNKLELILTEDINSLNVDPDLLQIVQKNERPDRTDTKYVMEATCSNATNEQTADELSAVLNQAYQSPLYEKDEIFRGVITYKEDGEYILRR